MKSFTAASLLFFATTASLFPTSLAHGFVRVVTIGGKAFTGPEPGTSGSSTDVIRAITDTNPNHLSDAGADLACGRNAATKGAEAMATGKAGDTIKFTWDAGDGTPWPHDSGPMLTYAANCGDSCKTFDATKGEWFKFDQVGKVTTPSNNWVQGEIHKGQDYSTNIPANIPAGNYIIRHEIIALHLADSKNGAEFYPSCSQVTITGGATSNATVTPTVSFPGAYSEIDPGIFINIWDKTGAYPFPGPALATFGGAAASNASNSTSTATPTITSSASASKSSSTDGGNGTGDGGDDCNSDSGSDGTTTLNSAASTSTDDCSDDTGADDNGSNTDGGTATTVYVTVTVTEPGAGSGATPIASDTILASTTSKSKKTPTATSRAKARRSRIHHAMQRGEYHA